MNLSSLTLRYLRPTLMNAGSMNSWWNGLWGRCVRRRGNNQLCRSADGACEKFRIVVGFIALAYYRIRRLVAAFAGLPPLVHMQTGNPASLLLHGMSFVVPVTPPSPEERGGKKSQCAQSSPFMQAHSSF